MEKYTYLVKLKLANGEWATVNSSPYESTARNMASQIRKEYNVETKVE